MISGDRAVLAGKEGAFYQTLQEFHVHWDHIDIICPKVSKKDLKLQSRVLFGNVFFHPSPWPLLLQPLWIILQGRRIFRRCPYDVVTVHEYPPFYNGIGALLLRFFIRKSTVLEVHHIVGDPVAASLSERIGYLLSRLWLPIVGRGVTAVRTVNQHVAKKLRAWGIPQRLLHVVHSFYLNHAALTGISPPIPLPFDVVFCGRIVANKGLDEVLRAIALVPHARLLVIGDGPEKAHAQKLARELKVLDRTEFRGWMSNASDVYKAMLSAKVFIMNSLSEGGPRVALEAMALGLPVLTTRVGIMQEVIIDRENGIFTTGKAPDVAMHLTELLKDVALRERLGKNAAMITERFERKHLIERYAHFLKSLV